MAEIIKRGELIPISENNSKRAVSARDLYNFLGCTERFQSWFDRQLQYGFTENVDYVGCKVFNALANQELQDYAMTISMAKEVSMIQRNEKGKEARTYFIACEQKLKETPAQQFQLPQTFSEALRLAADQAEQIEKQKKLIEAKDEQIKQDVPRVLFSKAVETAKRSCLIAELAKILQQNGINIGQNRLFVWMREHGYLCSKGQYYNQPTQKAMELGLFELKQTTINKPDGSVLVSTTTKVTGKGQVYFVNKFLNANLVGRAAV